MSIENRNLKAGTKLTARYKGKDHTAEVVKTDDGLRYRLKGGKEYKNPSSAASEKKQDRPHDQGRGRPARCARRRGAVLVQRVHGRLHRSGRRRAVGLP